MDDTLSDHQYSRRCGLETLRLKYASLKEAKIEYLEKEHEKILQGNYHQTLEGKVSMNDAMAERISQLCNLFNIKLSAEEAHHAMVEYRDAYDRNRRAVPGVLDLLKYLSNRFTVGVVTNGLEDVQREKIRNIGLEPYISFVLASETIGIRKPDPAIFHEALRLAGTTTENAIFVGDSWTSDIQGAHLCGLKTIWLNRYGCQSPDPAISIEIHSFEPLESLKKAFVIYLP